MNKGPVKQKYGFFPGCAYRSEAGYRESVNAVNDAVAIEMFEIEDWNCCGATTLFSLNDAGALALAGRLFALANRQAITEIVTPCNGCYATLRKTAERLLEDADALARVNDQLSGEQLRIETLRPVRHYLELLYHQVPTETWGRHATPALADIRIAGYYGCQLTRPWGDLDHPERPTILERLLRRFGFQTVAHSAQTLCCGAALAFPYEAQCLPLIRRIIDEMDRQGAQMVSTICPMCQLNLDTAQSKLNRPPLPITYFTQLAGLSLGLSPGDLGMQRLIVPAERILAPGHAVR